MPNADHKPRILFLCTGNSCRSQMAEGWTRVLKSSDIDVYSAGSSPHGLNPLAVRAMQEAGVDISKHTSKRPEQIGVAFDVVVTVCDSAHESCPIMPGARIVHVGFDDPPRLAKDASNDDEAMPHYRRVRDEIRAFVETLPAAIAPSRTPAHQPNPKAPVTTQNDKSCCGPDCCFETMATTPITTITATPTPTPTITDDAVRQQVREGYTKIAQIGSWSAAQTALATPLAGCCGGSSKSSAAGGCCGPATFSPEQLAAAIGYSHSELAAAPEGANMGLSCGNPSAIASLKPGEVVLDLGAGGGFDCFIAGPKVGASGKVIGVDMTPDMVTKARRNTPFYSKQTGLNNVEFRLGEIEHLPVADASVDVVISNCVLNLSPDKPQVWREIARVLRPGGRLAVSDLALLRPLPESVKHDVEALVGCVAGAVLVEETRAQAHAAGLGNIVLTPKPEYIDAMMNWQDPLYLRIIESLPAGTKPSDYITSLDMSAVKQ